MGFHSPLIRPAIYWGGVALGRPRVWHHTESKKNLWVQTLNARVFSKGSCSDLTKVWQNHGLVRMFLVHLYRSLCVCASQEPCCCRMFFFTTYSKFCSLWVYNIFLNMCLKPEHLRYEPQGPLEDTNPAPFTKSFCLGISFDIVGVWWGSLGYLS